MTASDVSKAVLNVCMHVCEGGGLRQDNVAIVWLARPSHHVPALNEQDVSSCME